MSDRRIGLLLVRRGGYGAGVFAGGVLEASKVGSRHVQGTTKAGGWSQQRFARRREGQARVAALAAAGDAAGVLLPALPTLESVVLGGDRRAVDALRGDPRLAAALALARERFLPAPNPTLAVLRDAPRRFRAVRVRLFAPLDHVDRGSIV